MKRKIVVGLIGVVAIIGVVMLSGCVKEVPTSTQTSATPAVSLPASTPIVTPTVTLITKGPLEMLLTIEDMPDEWMRCQKPIVISQSSAFEARYVEFSREIFGTDYLWCEIFNYHNISDAQRAFESSKRDMAEKVKIKSVGVGDESYGWKHGHQSGVYFRKTNIIVDIVFESQYGKPDIEHAKKFAEIVEKKII